MKRERSAQRISGQYPFLRLSPYGIIAFDKGYNLFCNTAAIGFEPVAERGVFFRTDGSIDFNAYNNKRLESVIQNQLVRMGGDSPEVEKFLAVLTVDDRVTKYFIVARREVNT
ncbi:hypothetical protein D1872_256960 [compost metagenome]